MSKHERDLLIARYWAFYEGTPVPQWIEELVGIEVLEIYGERYSTTRWFAHWWCIPCAIELEHRREPIITLRHLRRIAAHVRTVGYNFGPAIALSEDVTQENWARYLESSRRVAEWGADALRRQIEATPAAIQLRKELTAKKLPEGAAANLALMRTIVGLETASEEEEACIPTSRYRR
jgi:hypothetical protein